MSKENVRQFLSEAASNQKIKEKLQTVNNQNELADLAQSQGFEFEPEHLDAVIAELKTQPGFFGRLVEAALEIFSPTHDDYPNVGVEPFTGDPNRSR
jgi:predicted ribosomally synthesized peptide with nif11-like leader